MLRLRLVHWNAEEARERAAILASAGYEVCCEVPRSPEFLRELKKNLPDVVVIDLSRMPSQGRDLALLIRKNGSTRRIPLVFIGGEESTVTRIREILPDVVFTAWGRVRNSLKRAIAHPPSEPRVPSSVFEAYSGVPLPKKLGIKPGSVVGLIGPPKGFAKTLGSLPEGAELHAGAPGRCDLLICFVRSHAVLEREISGIAARTDYASVWFAWPKRASGVATDLSEKVVRECGLAAGLVDYKICAIDATWSGLLFVRRKQTPQS
jgi:CheY-like chemotaxis protein